MRACTPLPVHLTRTKGVPGAVGVGAIDEDKATLFIILGIGLAIAGYLTLEK